MKTITKASWEDIWSNLLPPLRGLSFIDLTFEVSSYGLCLVSSALFTTTKITRDSLSLRKMKTPGRANPEEYGYGMSLLIGLVISMYMIVGLLFIWFISNPQNIDRIKQRWWVIWTGPSKLKKKAWFHFFLIFHTFLKVAGNYLHLGWKIPYFFFNFDGLP